MAVTLGELAREVGGELHNGDPATLINAVATLQHAGEGDISFLANKGYRKFLRDTRASAVILAPAEVDACPTAAIVMDNPYAGYARAAAMLAPAQPDRQGIHPQALAIRSGAGHWAYGGVAQGKKFKSDDPDTSHLWWEKHGNGKNINEILELNTDDLGQGISRDTVVEIQHV